MAELFTNNSGTTVSAGGTTAPAGGTVETWTVAASASFPAASAGFHHFFVADPALPTEKIKVTNVAGPTWTVERGAEGTTPVAHNAGFTVVQVVTAGGLSSFQQAKPWQFFVDSPTYGAKGDGKVVADVATTNASAVITSASAGFTASDVGKNVMINGANGNTSGPLITTIASFQSPTQVTLSATAGATVSGCQMVWGTNDQTAIQAALDAAGAYAQANGYFAEVVFGDNIYILGGSPTQSGNGSSTPTFNTQLKIPTPNANGTTQKLVIALTGPGDNGFVQYWQSLTPNLAGACLVSMATAGNTPHATFGHQSVIGGPSGSAGFTGGFANVKAVVKGLQVVTSVYTNLIAYDFGYCSAMRIQQSSALAFAPSGVGGGTGPLQKDLTSQVAFQSTIGEGLRAPVNANNADSVADDVTVSGLARSFYVWDHFTANRIFSFYSDVALKIDSTFGVSGTGHGIFIQNLNAEVYNGGISINGGSNQLYINLDAETIAPAYDISDNSNACVGIVHFTDPADAGRNVGVVGATKLKIVDDNLRVRGFWSGAPAIPASGVATTPVYRDATVQVTGGTVTQIAVDGQNTGLTSGMFFVPSGKTLTITYSVAPTLRWWLT